MDEDKRDKVKDLVVLLFLCILMFIFSYQCGVEIRRDEMCEDACNNKWDPQAMTLKGKCIEGRSWMSIQCKECECYPYFSINALNLKKDGGR